MGSRHERAAAFRIAMLFGFAALTAGCGSKEAPAGSEAAAPAAPPAAAPAAPEATAAATPASAPATPASWTPEALEELLAPVALYPDPILSQLLIAATNPQEVLDAGNWLLQNDKLKGDALDRAAREAGFTAPVRALVQFPDIIDMMCREMDWTTQLGEAFKADQPGVLDAVQRLRQQAQSVGNLKTSAQMQVVNEDQDGKEVVVLKPASNGQVYVPQYDPVAVYAPPPATTTAVAPTTTTTTTTTETGHSTAALVTTGLLAFGAGILVNELFDDDDNYKNKYYYPNYGYGSMPYYPPYAYRPAYGNGWYPSHGYNPPPGYGNKFVNNGNIYVNTGRNDYWNRWNGKPPAVATPYNQARKVSSPITAARPNRNDLSNLNQRAPRPMPADVQRPSTREATPQNWKGQKTYAGASRPAGERPQPKVQGSYGGGYAGNASTREAKGPGAAASTRDVQGKPNKGGYQGADRPSPSTQQAKNGQASRGDRGYNGTGAGARPQPSSKNAVQPQDRAKPQTQDRPQYQTQDRSRQPQPAQQNRGGHDSAVGGADRGASDRQASQRGRQSMPQGAHSKGGGGGGKKGGKGKQR